MTRMEDDVGTKASALSLRFGSPVHGWLEVELIGPEDSSRFIASHVPGDSLTALAVAACELVEGIPPRRVTWFLEPAEVAWCFRRIGDDAEVLVQGDAEDLHRIGVGTVDAIGLLLWRALRRLEVDPAWADGDAAWLHAFPSGVVAALGARLGRRPARGR